MSDKSVSHSIEWRNAESLVYPNITVCHSKMFSTEAMEGKTKIQSFYADIWITLRSKYRNYTSAIGLNSSLASYLFVALDPYFQEYFKFAALHLPPGELEAKFESQKRQVSTRS